MFKGVLERADHEPQQVAVKQLKPDSLSTTLEDFEREIAIMQVQVSRLYFEKSRSENVIFVFRMRILVIMNVQVFLQAVRDIAG